MVFLSRREDTLRLLESKNLRGQQRTIEFVLVVKWRKFLRCELRRTNPCVLLTHTFEDKGLMTQDMSLTIPADSRLRVVTQCSQSSAYILHHHTAGLARGSRVVCSHLAQCASVVV